MARAGRKQTAEEAQLAAMARRARPLDAAVPEEVAKRIRVQAEAQMGLRCGGCGERIGVGLQFTRIDVVMHEGKPTVDVAKLSACNGADGCDFAAQAKEGADAMEMVEYVWLHGDPPVGVEQTLDEQVAGAEQAARGADNGGPAG